MITKKSRQKVSETILWARYHINQHRRTQALILVMALGVLLALALQGLLSFMQPIDELKKGENTVSEIHAVKNKNGENPFENISLGAHAVYVLDIKTKTVLFSKNENEKLPLASVTKLMTAFVARENFNESAVLTISKEDISTEGDSGLRVGERWRIGDLLDVMLLVSSNDAAHAIARFVGSGGKEIDDNTFAYNAFVSMMNEKARLLGLDQMEFINESGLDVTQVRNISPDAPVAVAGGYGSAQNVAELLALLWSKYPETIEITARKYARITSQDDVAHVLPNTNEIVGQISGLIASKTGFTDISGGNLAIIFDRGIGDPIVIVVLGSTYKGRFDDMEKLVKAVRET